MAERNFDEEYDYASKAGHSFTLGGHTFHTRVVAPPGAFLGAGRGLMAAIRFLRAVVVPEDRPMLERVLEAPDVTARLLDNAAELHATAAYVLAAQSGGTDEEKGESLKRLQEVVDRCHEPEESLGVLVSGAQLDAVAEWLMEETIGRPTSPASSSSGGAGAASNGSKATSSKAAKASKS